MGTSKEQIPSTTMDELYRKVKGRTRTVDSLQAFQLKMAQELAEDPSALASSFVESVETFAGYSNNEPFFPDDPKSLRRRRASMDKYGVGPTIDRANDLTARLTRQETVATPDGKLEFVERELWPARSTGGWVFSDERGARQAPKLDLLLKASDGVPVVAEVKVRSDQHPFYGLIQVLMMGAQLATHRQKQRLVKQLKFNGSIVDEPIELAIVTHGQTTSGRYRPQLLAAADQLISSLNSNTRVQKYVRSIRRYEAQLTNGIVSFELPSPA